MKLYLICNDPDTAIGMRLAGVESTLVQSETEAADALQRIAADDAYAVVLINRSLHEAYPEVIKRFRKAHSVPLLVDIPDKEHPSVGNALSEYIRDTVGINI